MRGAIVREFFLDKNPNVNKKMWRGGGVGRRESGGGAGEVGAGESFFYMDPNLK